MYDGAVMITASHLPSHRNGFKFFSKAGGLNKQNIAEVRENGEGELTTAPQAIDRFVLFDGSRQGNPSTESRRPRPLMGRTRLLR